MRFSSLMNCFWHEKIRREPKLAWCRHLCLVLRLIHHNRLNKCEQDCGLNSGRRGMICHSSEPAKFC